MMSPLTMRFKIILSLRRVCVKCASGQIIKRGALGAAYECVECDAAFRGVKLLWFRVAW